jgi:hypothetical protein
LPADVVPATQPRQRRLSRFGVASLPLHKSSDFSPKERGHRKTALRSKNPRLAQGFVVDGERDVPSS